METRLSPAQLLEQMHYCILSTSDRSGTPWVTPLFYAYDKRWQLYWISTPESRHSQLLAKNPKAAAVIYSPPDAFKETSALYLTGTVHQCGADELEDVLALYFERTMGGISSKPSDYLENSPCRFYRLATEKAFTLGEAEWSDNLLLDKRTEIAIPQAG